MFQIPSVYGDLKTHDDQLVRYVCKHESDDPDLVTKNKQNSDNKQDCNHEVTPGKKNQWFWDVAKTTILPYLFKTEQYYE